MKTIHINEVSKTFTVGKKNIEVLRKVRFFVKANEVFGFLGPNGAGKSTTIKILFNFLNPSKGEVLINGKNIKTNEFRHQIGYLPETPFLYNHLTAFETLMLSGQLSDCTPSFLKERIPILISRMELSHAINQKVGSFSKGMKQRLGIANALVHDPPILVFDEPMSGLDPLGRHMIKELIRELKGEGKTIFFSSHILSDIEELCDSIGIINKGSLLYTGALEKFQYDGSKSLEEKFIGMIEEHNANTV